MITCVDYFECQRIPMVGSTVHVASRCLCAVTRVGQDRQPNNHSSAFYFQANSNFIVLWWTLFSGLPYRLPWKGNAQWNAFEGDWQRYLSSHVVGGYGWLNTLCCSASASKECRLWGAKRGSYGIRGTTSKVGWRIFGAFLHALILIDFEAFAVAQ